MTQACCIVFMFAHHPPTSMTPAVFTVVDAEHKAILQAEVCTLIGRGPSGKYLGATDRLGFTLAIFSFPRGMGNCDQF